MAGCPPLACPYDPGERAIKRAKRRSSRSRDGWLINVTRTQGRPRYHGNAAFPVAGALSGWRARPSVAWGWSGLLRGDSAGYISPDPEGGVTRTAMLY
jgi:hypothetical protein